jgi:PLP dependent protein
MNKIDDKLNKVTERIARAAQLAARDPKSVHLIAVSKMQSTAAVAEAYAWGQRLFGENYLQEALAKQQELKELDDKYEDIEWHFIGPIQSNKTRAIAEHFAWVHSVDRLSIAERLNKQRPEHLSPLNICVQVNIDDEDTKSGVAPAQLSELVAAIKTLPRLRLRGLMAIPKATDDTQQQEAAFAKVAALQTDLNKQGFALDVLSMGMSNDLAAAIAQGATHVRVGTDIFGARQ